MTLVRTLSKLSCFALAITAANVAFAQSPSQYSAVEITQTDIDNAVAEMDGIVADVMTQTGVPGMAVAIVHNDAVVYAKGFGIKQIGSPDPIDENTVFQIASVSKSVSATIIAALVGDKEITWQTPIVEYMPGFTLGDPYVTQHVTIGDMFSHRSGLPGHAGDLLEDLGFDRETVFDRLQYLPLKPFRANYDYTNFGLTAGGVAAANAMGTDWETISKTRLFDQLGMTTASMSFADFQAQPNKALGNIFRDGTGWEATPQQRDPDAQAPAGGVSANVVDMAKWLRMVLNEGQFGGETIVAADPLKEAILPQSYEGPLASFDSRPSSYGYGIGIGTDQTGRVRFSHSGAFLIGTGTTYMLLPSENLGIIVLTNGTPVGAAEAVTQIFMDYVELGAPRIDWTTGYEQLYAAFRVNHSELADKNFPTNPTPAPDHALLIGNYHSDYFGELEIVDDGAGGLIARLGPDQTDYAIPHWDGKIFAWYAPGENGVGISAVTFNQTGEDNAESVTFEFLDEYGLGTFVRQNYTFGAFIERQPGTGGEAWSDDKSGIGVANGLDYALTSDASSPISDIAGPQTIAQRVSGGVDGNKLAVQVQLPANPPEEVVYLIYASDDLEREHAEVLATFEDNRWLLGTGSVLQNTPITGVDTILDYQTIPGLDSRFLWLGVQQRN
ncbi:serine hydrolase [Cerasicoccus fimbriatus]|uniref:serine hydrolase n=1 Tax=Cerasicoccus fimbriatus TaxID=3014554 RepID=UPI0022B4C089|nr:serine hydrolase [Cerasicoccus sp. TK19100]